MECWSAGVLEYRAEARRFIVLVVVLVLVLEIRSESSACWSIGFGFFAITTVVLVLLALPALIAAGLPVIDYLNRQPPIE